MTPSSRLFGFVVLALLAAVALVGCSTCGCSREAARGPAAERSALGDTSEAVHGEPAEPATEPHDSSGKSAGGAHRPAAQGDASRAGEEEEDLRISAGMDTVVLGLALKDTRAVGAFEYWVVLGAVSFPGNELFRTAALDLSDSIGAAGFALRSRTELLRLSHGALWPPNVVRFRVFADDASAHEALRSVLLDGSLASHAAASDRPDGYGSFFVQCGRRDSDLWTVWYP